MSGRRERQTPRAGRGCRALLVLAVVVLAAVGLVVFAWWNLFLRVANPVAPGQQVRVEIPRGSGTAEIAEILADAGVVANANMFRLEARESGLDDDLKAGEYDLETGMDYTDVLEILAEGPLIVFVDLSVPEGFTLEQIASRLQDETGLSAESFAELAGTGAASFDHEFLASNPTGSLEGYLFPKTYRVVEGSTVESVTGAMLDQFGKETADIDLTVVQQKGLSVHEWVTVASMIEREVRVPEERTIVASVIYNRLQRGMRLEIDATIEYILPGTRPRLQNSHLSIDSPYNTYMYEGLPPGPIASPGLAALEAAAAPAETPYLYYVLTDTDGSHTFTETYEEFLEAKERSRGVVP